MFAVLTQILSGLWEFFWTSDGVTMLMLGMVLGFVVATFLGRIGGSRSGMGGHKSKEDREPSGGSVEQIRRICV